MKETLLTKLQRESREDLKREFGTDEILESWVLDRIASTLKQAMYRLIRRIRYIIYA
jgi:hypothetical protein